jgi:hypothetical protein
VKQTETYNVMLRPKDRWAADVLVQCLRESKDPWIVGRHIVVRNSDEGDDRTSLEGPDWYTCQSIWQVIDKVLP